MSDLGLSHETAFAAASALRKAAEEYDQLAARHDKMSVADGYTDATKKWAAEARQAATDLAAELRALARNLLRDAAR